MGLLGSSFSGGEPGGHTLFMGKGLFTFHYHIEDVIVFVDYSILRVRRL